MKSPILGMCVGCRGLGWFPFPQPDEWICPGCERRNTDRGPITSAEFAFLRAMRKHFTDGPRDGFTIADEKDLYRFVALGEETPKCEGVMHRCEAKGHGVKLESSRTAYEPSPRSSWTRLLLDDEGLGEPPDPNAPIWLCRECAKSHHKYWDDMWKLACTVR